MVLTLPGHEQVEPLPQRDAVARPLVVGREAGRMGGLGDLAVHDLLEGVEALAARVEVVHEMHLGSYGEARARRARGVVEDFKVRFVCLLLMCRFFLTVLWALDVQFFERLMEDSAAKRRLAGLGIVCFGPPTCKLRIRTRYLHIALQFLASRRTINSYRCRDALRNLNCIFFPLTLQRRARKEITGNPCLLMAEAKSISFVKDSS